MASILCQPCRWIQRGHRKAYVLQRCKSRFSRRSILLTTALFLLLLEAGLLRSSAVSLLDSSTDHAPDVRFDVNNPQLVSRPDPVVVAIDVLLQRYDIGPIRSKRVAEAIVRSSGRHKIDPRLVASVVIVESRGNPFAISSSDAVGIMQIHVPTWARTVDQEEINLFKIEDNVEFGVRILKGYIDRYGHDEGIKRYNGWNQQTPEPSAAEAYLQRVRQIYGSARAD
jgi:Transglycosylase SLT domain